MAILKLNYEEILASACPSTGSTGDDGLWTSSAERWGYYQERYLHCDRVAVREIVTDFQEDCQIGFTDGTLPDSVHICIPLHGSLTLSYHTCRLYTELRPRTHHHLYVPVTDFERTMSKNVRLVDVAVERDYLIGLLSDTEAWSASLRAKLLRRDITQGRQAVMCPGMQQVIHDILNTPLTGYVKKMYIEAKVLELIALQLHQSREREGRTRTLKKKDKDALQAVHDYLTATFREEHSLRRLSKMFGLNEFILKSGFKSLYGKTIFDFLFELKMRHARQLLLEEGKMVCEVSREVGYRNPNHFSTAFKKKFGVNPILMRQA